MLKWHDNEMSWTLCTWMDYDKLEWVGSGNLKVTTLKVDIMRVSLHIEYYLIVWLYFVYVSA